MRTDLTACRILVVDDEELQRDIICSQLFGMGCSDVCTAVNGANALQFFDDPGHPIDVVICDLSMPDMDGLVFMRNLAKRGAQTSIILISGSDEEILHSAEGLGLAHGLSLLGALVKPSDPKRLAALLQTLPSAHGKPYLASGTALTREELVTALEARQFIPWYQPKLDLSTGKAVGVEALARWYRDGAITMGPGQFVPVMETEGLIDDLFFQMADHAAKHLSEWHALGINKCTMALNLSMDTAKRLDLPDRLGQIVAHHGLKNSDFVIEVTESRLAVDRSLTMETLTRLSLMGFTLSIDDFGTGYSSLVQLIDLPFQELKIDGSFVRRASTERKAQTVLHIALLLGTHLRMKVIAEGVETAEQIDHLKQGGATLVQGYHIAKPMSFDHCTIWLKLHGNNQIST